MGGWAKTSLRSYIANNKMMFSRSSPNKKKGSPQKEDQPESSELPDNNMPRVGGPEEEEEEKADTRSKQEKKRRNKRMRFLEKHAHQIYSIEVDYDMFSMRIWPHIKMKGRPYLTASLVWSEIVNRIKGSTDAYTYRCGYMA